MKKQQILVVDDDATLVSLLGFSGIVALLHATLGPADSASGAGEALGRLGAACACAGVIVGWLGSKAVKRWSWWGWVWRWSAVLAVLWALAAYGQHGSRSNAVHRLVSDRTGASANAGR